MTPRNQVNNSEAVITEKYPRRTILGSKLNENVWKEIYGYKVKDGCWQQACGKEREWTRNVK